MEKGSRPELVSVHGGHSGQFCIHARNSLEEIVRAYIRAGFSWVGITEHMPSVNDALLPPDEAEAGLTAQGTFKRFTHYVAVCRELQKQFASRIEIFVGFEAEVCSGYEGMIRQIIDRFNPDYMVGSVHYVNDILIDWSQDSYKKAAEMAGGLDRLYCDYFDRQYDLIMTFGPPVVGHFDLVRIFDQEYPQRLTKGPIWERIARNLRAVKERDLILELNTRALKRGQREPYPSRSILVEARRLGIPVVPGDDSHGVDDIGRYDETGVRLLRELGFSTNWRKPVASISY